MWRWQTLLFGSFFGLMKDEITTMQPEIGRGPERDIEPPKPEQLPVPERYDVAVPQESPRPAERITASPPTAPTGPTAPPLPAQPKDPAVQEVETVLEEGLGDVYRSMDEATQQEFREQGEATASRITDLLQSARVQVQKIVRLITSWLRIIPGISRLFIEQEAKIKTDRLLAMKRKQGGEE